MGTILLFIVILFSTITLAENKPAVKPAEQKAICKTVSINV